LGAATFFFGALAANAGVTNKAAAPTIAETNVMLRDIMWHLSLVFAALCCAKISELSRTLYDRAITLICAFCDELME
jgi:hypothetical protein